MDKLGKQTISSEYSSEREYVCEGLPDHDPSGDWLNFEIKALNEVGVPDHNLRGNGVGLKLEDYLTLRSAQNANFPRAHKAQISGRKHLG